AVIWGSAAAYRPRLLLALGGPQASPWLPFLPPFLPNLGSKKRVGGGLPLKGLGLAPLPRRRELLGRPGLDTREIRPAQGVAVVVVEDAGLVGESLGGVGLQQHRPEASLHAGVFDDLALVNGEVPPGAGRVPDGVDGGGGPGPLPSVAAPVLLVL